MQSVIGATQGKLRSDPIVLLRSQPEMTVPPLQTRPSKVRATRNHDKLIDLSSKWQPSVCRFEADGVLLVQKCPLLYRNEPATRGWAVNLIRKFTGIDADPKQADALKISSPRGFTASRMRAPSSRVRVSMSMPWFDRSKVSSSALLFVRTSLPRRRAARLVAALERTAARILDKNLVDLFMRGNFAPV
jgi:hypothetical protein